MPEFKTVESSTSTAVLRSIRTAAGQLREHGGGDLVIDGRPSGLTEELAREGWARFRGQAERHGQVPPRRVLVLLPDDRMVDVARER